MIIMGSAAANNSGLKNATGNLNSSISDTAKTEGHRVLGMLDYLTTQLPQWGPLKNIKHQKTYSDIWVDYRNAANTPVSVNQIDELRAKLGIAQDWNNAPQLKHLLDHMQTQGLANPQTLTYIDKIIKEHGKATEEAISKSLSDYLSSFSSPGDEQKGIIRDALHDIAYPSNINQSNKDTCTATAVQIKTAIERPVQYVDMLVSLAKDQPYTLPSGNSLQPDNVWRYDANDNRSYSCKILENAFMSLERTYIIPLPAYDSIKDNAIPNPWQIAHLVSQIFGAPQYENHSVALGKSLYQQVEDDIARGRPTVVCFTGHAVLAVGIDKSSSPNRVIIDSWGKQVSMTVDEFTEQVLSVCSFNDPGPNKRQVPAGSKQILGDTDS